MLPRIPRLALPLAGLLGVCLLACTAAADGSPAPAPDGAATEAAYPGVFGPDTRQGYVVRQETWNGALPVGENTPIRQELFKNNQYRFYAWSDVKGATISIHVYDQDGNLAESRSWDRADDETHFAGADVRPGYTGTYFLIVKVERSPARSTAWQLVYAYK